MTIKPLKIAAKINFITRKINLNIRNLKIIPYNQKITQSQQALFFAVQYILAFQTKSLVWFTTPSVVRVWGVGGGLLTNVQYPRSRSRGTLTPNTHFSKHNIHPLKKWLEQLAFQEIFDVCTLLIHNFPGLNNPKIRVHACPFWSWSAVLVQKNQHQKVLYFQMMPFVEQYSTKHDHTFQIQGVKKVRRYYLNTYCLLMQWF